MDPTSSAPESSSSSLAKAKLGASLQIVGSMTVGGTFYGFMTVTAGLCAHSLIQTRQTRSGKHLVFLLVYIGVLWTTGTVMIGGVSGVAVETYVIHASSSLESPYAQEPIPGGSTLVATAAYWMVLILSDGMMIWRFKVVWSTSRFYRYLITVPVVLYAVISVFGFLSFIIFCNRPLWGSASVKQDLITAMICSSFCLNVHVTATIAGRLFHYRRRFKANWGSPDTGHYTSMGSILIESYLPLTFSTIPLLVTYTIDNPAVYMLVSILGQMQIIALLMVMLRVSRGVAWNSSTAPHSVESAIDRALAAHDEQFVQSAV
ncbi:hypothetical protein CONPUDRAFT_162078 [Coniophora puteana RWD-64-598 SS2]|uniref:Uncharacterized protein n=1 Tax=Coniophora puteana (strain RWD-64-598) TaxID=741705 RepID=A0A5M3N019_CONPW|nr:uncharacterized protein CONPUDRAFT_162078 [Coniophora puteana RWD-64-598 SS2]EIW84729.1 hypothetical protein CONPUDRAFT_162078 [Coniophora puteana RWD-64-598 SS2]